MLDNAIHAAGDRYLRGCRFADRNALIEKAPCAGWQRGPQRRLMASREVPLEPDHIVVHLVGLAEIFGDVVDLAGRIRAPREIDKR